MAPTMKQMVSTLATVYSGGFVESVVRTSCECRCLLPSIEGYRPSDTGYQEREASITLFSQSIFSPSCRPLYGKITLR